jgi:hypothetical protein
MTTKKGVDNFQLYVIMLPNVLGLCEGGEIEAQMFNSAPKFNRITNAQI